MADYDDGEEKQLIGLLRRRGGFSDHHKSMISDLKKRVGAIRRLATSIGRGKLLKEVAQFGVSVPSRQAKLGQWAAVFGRGGTEAGSHEQALVQYLEQVGLHHSYYIKDYIMHTFDCSLVMSRQLSSIL